MLGIGIVFTLVNILFIAISTLLIYSLLLVTVEKKTFINGVQRLLGLKKVSFIAIIFLQSLFFVFPSIFIGIAGSIPALWAI